MVWGRFQGCIEERVPGVRAQAGKYAGLGGAEGVHLQAAVMETGLDNSCAIRRPVKGRARTGNEPRRRTDSGVVGMRERARRSRVRSKNKADQGVLPVALHATGGESISG
jgi:hypothetical protein